MYFSKGTLTVGTQLFESGRWVGCHVVPSAMAKCADTNRLIHFCLL